MNQNDIDSIYFRNDYHSRRRLINIMERLFRPFDSIVMRSNKTVILNNVPVTKPKQIGSVKFTTASKDKKVKVTKKPKKVKAKPKGKPNIQVSIKDPKAVNVDSVDIYQATNIIKKLGSVYTRYYEYNATSNNVSKKCVCKVQMTINGTMFPYGVNILKPQAGIQYIVSLKFYAADGAAYSPCTHGSNIQMRWDVSEEGTNLDFNYYVGRTIDGKFIPSLNKNDCFYKYEPFLRDERYTYKCP